MVTLLKREFTVNVALQRAWDHLARVEQWPSCTPHIKEIELKPPGELGHRRNLEKAVPLLIREMNANQASV